MPGNSDWFIVLFAPVVNSVGRVALELVFNSRLKTALTKPYVDNIDRDLVIDQRRERRQLCSGFPLLSA